MKTYFVSCLKATGIDKIKVNCLKATGINRTSKTAIDQIKETEMDKIRESFAVHFSELIKKAQIDWL